MRISDWSSDVCSSDLLAQRLFVPETFRLEDKDAIAGRQDAELAIARSEPDRIMILIGEIRSIESARYGEKILIKHMPQRPFIMDAAIARRFHTSFAAAGALWRADERADHLLRGLRK